MVAGAPLAIMKGCNIDDRSAHDSQSFGLGASPSTNEKPGCGFLVCGSENGFRDASTMN